MLIMKRKPQPGDALRCGIRGYLQRVYTGAGLPVLVIPALKRGIYMAGFFAFLWNLFAFLKVGFKNRQGREILEAAIETISESPRVGKCGLELSIQLC
jgi:hypothetical protein